MSLELWNYAPEGKTADNLGPMDYLEYRDTGKEQYSPGASTANRTFITRWTARARFLDDLLGYSFTDSAKNIYRILPAEHPEIENFFAEDATVEGFGKLGSTFADTVDWTCSKINCNYKPRDYFIKDDKAIVSEQERYTSRQFVYSSDYLTLQGNMILVSNCKVLASPPGRLTPAVEAVYTWHEVPADPVKPFIIPNLTAVTACLGKINSVTFDVFGLNAPPGTVLFVGLDSKMQTPKLSGETATNPVGNYFWELMFKFLYRNNGQVTVRSTCGDHRRGLVTGNSGPITEFAGHNYVFNLDLNRYDLVTNTGFVDGTRIYTSTDLNTLWTLG